MSNTVSFADVQAARERLRGVAKSTPVVTSRTLNALVGRQVFLKCENFQRGGSFKFRGAYNTIAQLPEAERQRGVVAFSSGNHAQGVAMAAQLLGAPATIVMPSDAPSIKVAGTRGYGAEVVQYDRLREDREAIARTLANERGLTLVPPFDHPQIMAGAGTATLELLEEVPDLDAVVAPIGGGGLISGTAVAAHGKNAQIAVIGVEPEDANDTQRSLAAGERIEIPPPATMADGLRIVKPGALTFPVVQEHVSEIVTVSEQEILDAVRFALLRMKLVIEPSGAVTLAAALSGRLPAHVQRIGLIISGGNIDPELLAQLWNK